MSCCCLIVSLLSLLYVFCSLLCSNLLSYSFNLLILFVFLFCMFCFLFCEFCVFVLFCVLFLHMCNCLFSIRVQFYQPLPPGENPIAVNIISYHIISYIILYHIIWYHITSCHIIYHNIETDLKSAMGGRGVR